MPAAAEQIQLQLKGGTIRFEGTLVSFDGATYVITSNTIGTLSLHADKFDCIGEACGRVDRKPDPAPPRQALQPSLSPALAAPSPKSASRIGVYVPVSMSPTLLPDLVRGWIAAGGGRMVREIGAQTGEVGLVAVDRTGTEVARIALQRRDATAAFAAVHSAEAEAEVVVTDRRISDAEATALAPLAGDLRSPARERVIALDALAAVVAPKNPLAAISSANLARIFSGQISDWAELGQPAGRIKVYASRTTTGPGSLFESLILKPHGRALLSSIEQLGSSAGVAEAVAQDPRSIGIAYFADMRNAKPLNIEQSCGLVTEASSFAIKTEEYPVSRRIYLYTARAQLSEPARSLLDFIASPAGEDIVADHLLVNQRIDALAFAAHSARFAHAASRTPLGPNSPVTRLLNDLAGARRSTMTIRFDSGTSLIDNKSQTDLRTFVQQLAGQTQDRPRITLLGFTDNIGSASKNSALAAKRAQQARTALLNMAGGRIDPSQVIAIGQETHAPVACDDTERGRQLNRRVEVWLKDPPRPASPGSVPTNR